MRHLNPYQVLQQYGILHIPLTADVKMLRDARDNRMHDLYHKSIHINEYRSSLSLDHEISLIQHAYLYIKRNFHAIHAHLNIFAELKEKFELLKLPLDASHDDIRRRRDEFLHSLRETEKNSTDDLSSLEKKKHDIQHAYLFIVNHLRLMKLH